MSDKPKTLAKKYAESCDNESGGFLAHQPIAIRKKAFLKGYSAAIESRKEMQAEIECTHPLRDFFGDIEGNITTDESYESAVVAKLESMADDYVHLDTEPFGDLAQALVAIYFNNPKERKEF